MGDYEEIRMDPADVPPCGHFKMLIRSNGCQLGCELTSHECPFDNIVGFRRYPERQFHCRNYAMPVKEKIVGMGVSPRSWPG